MSGDLRAQLTAAIGPVTGMALRDPVVAAVLPVVQAAIEAAAARAWGEGFRAGWDGAHHPGPRTKPSTPPAGGSGVSSSRSGG